MRTAPLGPDGPRVSVVGQGTWCMEQDPAASIRALRHGLELGLTHVDTAEMYGEGRVEEIVGEALGHRRDELFLVSKVYPHNASRAGVVSAAERSLTRLGTDRLDLYLLHWPGSHPIAETLAGFEDLRAAGKIVHWGLSNFDVPELGAALGAAASPCRSNQVLYHLQERAVEHGVLPACREQGVPLVAYSPLGQGRFPAPGSEGRALLDRIAADHGVSAAAVALARLLAEGVFVIPKAVGLEHVEANAKAAEIALTAEERTAIDAVFPRGEPRALPML